MKERPARAAAGVLLPLLALGLVGCGLGHRGAASPQPSPVRSRPTSHALVSLDQAIGRFDAACIRALSASISAVTAISQLDAVDRLAAAGKRAAAETVRAVPAASLGVASGLLGC